MLVIVGPSLDGAEKHTEVVCRLTGLAPYDLKTRLSPDSWGVVRALADPVEAEVLAENLRQIGLRAVAVDPAITRDPARRMVSVRTIELLSDVFIVNLRDGTLKLPYQKLIAIVRGELRSGETGLPRSGASRVSGPYLSATATPVEGWEAVLAGGFDAMAVADLHFLDPLCVGRIDIKTFDFASLGFDNRNVEILEALVNRLASRAGVRVDRASRRSSLLSLVPVSPQPRSVAPESAAGSDSPSATATPCPVGSARASGPSSSWSALRTLQRAVSDPRFDGYSRLVGEAERLSVSPAAGHTSSGQGS